MNSNEMITWAVNWLNLNKYSLQNSPEIILETPWSTVIKFTTVTEAFYLKQTAPPIYIEAEIIKLLSQKFNAHVADLIATNDELHCFLMRDAGPSLRKYLNTNFDPELLCHAIKQFAALQRSVENNLQPFFDLGVPDWRLDKIPELYDEILEQNEILVANGLTNAELQLLRDLRVNVVEQCTLLEQYAIPATLVQPDCNTNNILINTITNQMTNIDLGEIAIAHPFLSLDNFLFQTTLHEGLNELDPTYNQVLVTYLHNWLEFATKDQLFEIMELTRKIRPIYGTLFHLRLMLSVDPQEYTLYYANKQNQLAKNLKDYIEINT